MDLLFTDDTVDKQITIVTDDKKINSNFRNRYVLRKS